MTELRRFMDNDGDEFVRDLLRSAEQDIPNAAARARTLTMLAGGAGAAGVGAATMSGAAGVNVATSAAASAGWKMFGLSAWKWLALLAVASALVAFAVNAQSERGHAPPTEADEPAATPVMTNRGGFGSPKQEEKQEIVAPPAIAAPVIAVASTEPAVAKRLPVPVASAAPVKTLSLAEETAMLDQARAALDARDPARALAALDRYDREAKQRMLGPEATMVRIEALHAKGDDAAARKLGRRFLAQNPGSTYEDRVKTLIGDVTP